jgi:hypothetical protein
MAAEGYEGTPDYFINTVTIDSLLRGCTEKRAALVTLKKNLRTLIEAMQYLKSAIANQKLNGGVKKEIKRVSFNESSSLPPGEPHIHMTNRTPSESSSKSSTTILESIITKLEDQ